MMTRKLSIVFSLFLALGIFAPVGMAQTTGFIYQGSLNASGVVANGNHDFEFALFDAGGTQLGATITQSSVSVTNGIFAVSLDFGSQFPGAQRFLEIRVRPTGGGAFTPLTPRQQITSAPYAVKSLNSETAATATNATQLGGIAANQFVVITDPRMTDARNPLPASENYIQNQNAGEQVTSNFNISGTGTANILNAATQYNIGGNRLLSIAGTGNFFAGVGAGSANTTGAFNSFFGTGAGQSNTTASDNSYFGVNAGFANTTGNFNSFFGTNSGVANTTGRFNSFFGAAAGGSNMTGGFNSFFGNSAGGSNTTGPFNSFFGRSAGQANTIGGENSYFGVNAGLANTTGNFNSFFGTNSGLANTASFNSFFGRSAGQANTTGGENSYFGVNAGLANTTGAANAFFGTNSGVANTTGNFNSFFGREAGKANTTGTENSFFGTGAGEANSIGESNAFFGSAAGKANTVGGANSFFGAQAGFSNRSGRFNAFFGTQAGRSSDSVDNAFFGVNAGLANTTGFQNSFFGTNAGSNNVSGTNLTLVGQNTTLGSGDLIFATAIGASAHVSENHSLVLGGIAGINGVPVSTRVGIGTPAPRSTLDVRGNIFVGLTSNPNVPAENSIFLANDSANAGNSFRFDAADNYLFMIAHSSATSLTGAGLAFRTATAGGGEIDRVVINPTGTMTLFNLGVAGDTDVCRNGANELSTCSSSLRYKSGVQAFTGGLDIVRRLRPITFNWSHGGTRDVGFGAEEVAKVAPLLATRNVSGEIEGVKYKQITTVLVNAVNEQQEQIEVQRREIDLQRAANARQSAKIDALVRLVCASNKDADICKEQ